MEKAAIRTPEDFLNNLSQEYIFGDRKGVIQLAAPMININAWKAAPSYALLELGITEEQFERIAYFADVVIKASGTNKYEEGQIISWADYDSLPAEEKEKLDILQGAEAIEFLLGRRDIMAIMQEARTKEIECMASLEKLWDEYDDPKHDNVREICYTPVEEDYEYSNEEKEILDIDKKIHDTTGVLQETRCLINALRRGTDDLIIREIKLFPLELKGLLKEALERAPYLEYDLETLLRRIVVRNNRVEKLAGLEAPDIIMLNEKRMLQEYVDCYIANGRRGRPYMGDRTDERCPFVSLADIALMQAKLV